MNIGLTAADYIVLSIGVVTMLVVSLVQRRGSVREALYAKSPAVQLGVVYLLLFSVLIFGAYGLGYDASQFIYNQF